MYLKHSQLFTGYDLIFYFDLNPHYFFTKDWEGLNHLVDKFFQMNAFYECGLLILIAWLFSRFAVARAG